MLIRIKKKQKAEAIHYALDIYTIIRDILLSKHIFDREKEHFWVIILSRNNQIRYIDEVSIGNLYHTIVSPREVFRFAILKGANSIIIAHNHPSGNLNPSISDINIVKELTEAGKIIGIEIIDSLIISDKSYYSFSSMDKQKRLQQK